MRYFLKLAYNGTGFHGWQMQKNAHSIQQEISDNLSTILSAETPVMGCGRTDAGVHAKEFYAHFDANSLNQSAEKLIYRLNSMTHKNIVIHDLLKVKDDAHARFDATKRSYEYLITTQKNPFILDLAYRYNQHLNLDRMNEACEILIGEKDFGCFCKVHSDNKTNICHVTEANWTKEKNTIQFSISANRFLRNMVRAIVGTMLDIGQDNTSIEDLSSILASGKRTEAGRSVPAHGLSLTKVEYPTEIFLRTS
ncbi:MAG: tRNA pseudouridine(38-40) synthase TruA [Flavobacteriales bacterium]|jgi:tRNA pseudouridine38-40 synthase|nr:tRNA pseudouridine(38-40) synthase TruA [Flavobacteriales bacterium]